MNSFYNQDSGSGTKRGKAMNAAKVTLTATILAAALGLALGLAAAPAMADKPVMGKHGHGGGNGDVLATPLDVILNNVSGPVDSVDCTGTSAPPSVLAVDVDPGCTISMDSIVGLGDLGGVLSLYRVEVRTRKNRGTDISLYFSAGEPPSAVNDVSVYSSDRLDATVCIESVAPTRIYLTSSFPQGGVRLRKITQPSKDELTVGEVDFAEFCYHDPMVATRCPEDYPTCAPD